MDNIDAVPLTNPKKFVSSHISSALAGVFAGGCGICVGHPFDTLKTRMQVGKYFDHSRKYTRLQTMRQLYRGILPPLLTSGIMQSINFSLYESFKKLVYSPLGDMFQIPHNERSNHTSLYLSSVFIAGACSGTFISIIATPISLIKVQQQLATKMGVIECAKTLYSKYGFLRFYRGYCCMFIMESYGRGVYLLAYESSKLFLPTILNPFHQYFVATNYKSVDTISLDVNTKTQLPKNTLITNKNNNNNNNSNIKSTPPSSSSSSSKSSTPPYFTESSLAIRMLSAATAGCTSWLSIYPCDVIKTRMQLDIEAIKFTSCHDCLSKTWSEGGMFLLFRGIKYTLIRAAPVAATILPIYEYTKEFFDRKLMST